MPEKIDFNNLEIFTEKYPIDLEVVKRTKLVAQVVKLREESGISLDTVSRDTGIAKEKLLLMEKGSESPTLDEFIKITNYFHQDIILVNKAKDNY